MIPPGGYLLVWADNESGQNNTNRPDLHVNFALSKGGEAIGLFGADGSLVDAVSFGPQTTDKSQGRFPDGAENLFNLTTPTPRATNVLSNASPTIGVSFEGNGMLRLSFIALRGHMYQLEYKNNLVDPWMPLGEAMPGTDGVLVVDIDPIQQPQRFYRLTVSP